MHARRVERFDVVVIGGGAGGLAAASGAARTGARTLLVERYGFIGGAATNAQVLAYCGFYLAGPKPIPSVAGVGRQVLNSLGKIGVDIAPIVSKSGYWIVMFDPEAAKLAFDRVAAENGVEVRLHSRLVSAQRDGDRIVAVDLLDHAGLTTVEAAAFVDASGEANLAFTAGEKLSLEGGPGAHVQPASLPIRIGGVAPGTKLDRKILSELIRTYNATADKPILRLDGGVMAKLSLSSEFWWMAIDLETDGMTSESLSKAEVEGREQAWRNLAVLRQHPGFENAYLASSGPQLGIRETRRPCSRFDVTEDDATKGTRSREGIARASWPMEVHEAPGRARFIDIGGEGFFDVPHQAIEAKTISNLRLAGRVIGATPAAYGSVRVMGTAFATGHAAGISAALSIGKQQADVVEVRKLLSDQGAII